MPIVTLDSLKSSKKSAAAPPGRGARPPMGGPAQHSEDVDDEDYVPDEDDGGNEYYTGGAGPQGGSGLAVQAPRGEGGNPLSAALRRAREQGVAAPAPGRRVAQVTVYRDGFTVDGGPFRPLSEPANKAFADALSKGFCPPELVQNNQPADVKLDDRHTEAYVPPARPTYEAFAGQGQSVGEIALSHGLVITAGVESQGMLVIDETQATIRVQIKYPDGTKEVAKFQPHHTVRHLLALVERNKSVGRYQVLTGNRGPPKPIEASALDQNLTDAGLAGSVVTIRNVS